MNWFTGVVLYTLIWWTTLFAVLPFGTKPVAEADTATGWRGAPTEARMGRKLAITTGIAAMLWVAAYVIIRSSWFNFRGPSLTG